MLWDSDAHEPLVDATWDEARARAAIRAIVAGAEEAFDDRGWAVHPLDVAPGDPERWSGTYLGGAGIVDALHGWLSAGSSRSAATTCRTSNVSSRTCRGRA